MSKAKKLVSLTKTADVIDAIGANCPADMTPTKFVAKLTGREYNAAFNWRSQHTFPSNTYVVMRDALAERGFCAPDSLWAMTEQAVA